MTSFPPGIYKTTDTYEYGRDLGCAMTDDRTNVAIACQGGGSHTAFTAGVLEHLLANWPERYRIVGISGTSGGAFNATAVWYELVADGRAAAAETVTDVWHDLAADDGIDRAMNGWLRTVSRLQSAGAPIPRVSPYHLPGPEPGKERIRAVLERYVDFEEIPEYCERTAPELVVGTVNVDSGEFETFVNEAVTVEAVLASAAVPNLYRAVEIDGHYHWDGLFSQNPPVRDLLHQPPERKPEEVWIVQINDQSMATEPRRLDAIADRRNELSGNISLNQELAFVEQVTEWVEAGMLPADRFTTPEIHRLVLDGGYSSATKLDRDPAFISELIERGRERAAAFLDSKK